MEIRSDFTLNKDIKSGEEVFYDGQFGIQKYTAKRQGEYCYLIRLDGSCSDVVCLGNFKSKCQGVFRTLENAYDCEAERLENSLKAIRRRVGNFDVRDLK